MATKPVVVGVDGSEESLLAAEWAAMEAKRHALPLQIVSAPATTPRVHAYHASPGTVATALRDAAARALEAAAARSEEVAPGLPVETCLLSGRPVLAVARAGSGASILIVGARGGGGFAAMILGSVSRYVASRAACPVVVVRQENMAVHREIAVGIRDPQNGGEALAFAFEEASIRHADLVVVHAWHWPPAALRAPVKADGADVPPIRAEHVSAEAGSRLSAALLRWRDKYPDVRVRQDVIYGHPARVLASHSTRSDLVVLDPACRTRPRPWSCRRRPFRRPRLPPEGGDEQPGTVAPLRRGRRSPAVAPNDSDYGPGDGVRLAKEPAECPGSAPQH
jgi:nucleotide-binding universal stress UspA family protein